MTEGFNGFDRCTTCEALLKVCVHQDKGLHSLGCGDVPGHATQAMLPAGVIVVATRSHGPTYIEGLHKHTSCSLLQSFMEIVGAHFLRSICST